MRGHLQARLPPLLALPADRVRAESQDAEERAQVDTEWKHRVRVLGLRCALGYFVGLAIVWTSMHLTGDYALMALWGGMFVGNGVPLALIYDFVVKVNE